MSPLGWAGLAAAGLAGWAGWAGLAAAGLAGLAGLGWAGLGWADLLANCLIGSSFRTLAVSNVSNNSLLRLCFVAASHQAAQTSHNELKCSSEVEFEASTPNYPRHG